MSTQQDIKEVSEEEIARVLADVGEDATADRIAQVKAAIDLRAAPHQDRQGASAVIEAARLATSSTAQRAGAHSHHFSELETVLIQAIESSGFSVSGPTDSRAAENGEPVWVCNARGALAESARSRNALKTPVAAINDSARGPDGLPHLVLGSDQDRNTILAALRFYQQQGMGDPANRSDAIHDIATNFEEDISIDDAGLDDLCERVNSAAMLPPRLTHATINEAVYDAGIRPTFEQSSTLCRLLDQNSLYHRAEHFRDTEVEHSDLRVNGSLSLDI